MDHILACNCGEVIVKSNGLGSKIRGKLLVFKEDGAYSVCRGCNAEVPVPVHLDTDVVKALSASTTNLPLYVKK